jgi:hypothetical protein
MAFSFSADEAEASIHKYGFFSLPNRTVGHAVAGFSTSGFPIKSPLGLDFIAQHSLDQADIRALLDSILGRPYWGLIKVYGDRLPDDHVFRFHDGSNEAPHTLLIQLLSPGSKVVLYEGSQKQSLVEVDKEVSEEWGLIALEKSYVPTETIERAITMESGGLMISDSRVNFTILKGIIINIGFTTQDELQHWAKMILPHSHELKTKIRELESKGFRINYTWPKRTK